MTYLLETSHLTKTFGAIAAAQDINIMINKKEIVTIIGANGAGKTTFINMITGYLAPSSGSILFCGRDITNLSPVDTMKIGICRSFQVAQLFPELSVLENILIAQSAAQSTSSLLTLSPIQPLKSEKNKQHALEVLDAFSIQEHAKSNVNILAQGVRKLLDIAMAMITHPKLLLLDEPTSGVAIEEKFSLMDTVMAGIKHSDTSVIFVEHDMDIVRKYTTRIIAFADGLVIADGTVDSVLSDRKVQELVL